MRSRTASGGPSELEEREPTRRSFGEAVTLPFRQYGQLAEFGWGIVADAVNLGARGTEKAVEELTERVRVSLPGGRERLEQQKALENLSEQTFTELERSQQDFEDALFGRGGVFASAGAIGRDFGGLDPAEIARLSHLTEATDQRPAGRNPSPAGSRRCDAGSVVAELSGEIDPLEELERQLALPGLLTPEERRAQNALQEEALGEFRGSFDEFSRDFADNLRERIEVVEADRDERIGDLNENRRGFEEQKKAIEDAADAEIEAIKSEVGNLETAWRQELLTNRLHANANTTRLVSAIDSIDSLVLPNLAAFGPRPPRPASPRRVTTPTPPPERPLGAPPPRSRLQRSDS